MCSKWLLELKRNAPVRVNGLCRNKSKIERHDLPILKFKGYFKGNLLVVSSQQVHIDLRSLFLEHVTNQFRQIVTTTANQFLGGNFDVTNEATACCTRPNTTFTSMTGLKCGNALFNVKEKRFNGKDLNIAIVRTVLSLGVLQTNNKKQSSKRKDNTIYLSILLLLVDLRILWN